MVEETIQRITGLRKTPDHFSGIPVYTWDYLKEGCIVLMGTDTYVALVQERDGPPNQHDG